MSTASRARTDVSFYLKAIFVLCVHAFVLGRTNRLDEFCVLVRTLKLIWLLLRLDPISVVSLLIEDAEFIRIQQSAP